MDTSNEITRQQWNQLERKVERLNARNKLHFRAGVTIIGALVTLWGAAAFSAPSTPATTVFPDLYQFSPNTPALASEVNSNFATVRQIAGDNAAHIDTKLDKSGGAVSGNLKVNGLLEVGQGAGTAIRMSNDSDIIGVDVIQGFNDVRIQGDASGGDDLVIEASGRTVVKHDLRVEGSLSFAGQSSCHIVVKDQFGLMSCLSGEFVVGMINTAGIRCCKF